MLNMLRKLRCTDGSEIAEAALVLPLIFMFLLGIIWFGRAFSIYATITHAAQQGAILAARPTCGTCTPPNVFPTSAEVDNAVFAVTDAANLDRNQIAPHPPATLTSCPAPAPQPAACSSALSKVSVCRAVVLNEPTTAPQCGVIVGFTYPFQFFLPFTSLNMQQITLTATAQSRMEN
jgi:Flp pilus assembly protein TadG